jgi:hypothetical protein
MFEIKYPIRITVPVNLGFFRTTVKVTLGPNNVQSIIAPILKALDFTKARQWAYERYGEKGAEIVDQLQAELMKLIGAV